MRFKKRYTDAEDQNRTLDIETHNKWLLESTIDDFLKAIILDSPMVNECLLFGSGYFIRMNDVQVKSLPARPGKDCARIASDQPTLAFFPILRGNHFILAAYSTVTSDLLIFDSKQGHMKLEQWRLKMMQKLLSAFGIDFNPQTIPIRFVHDLNPAISKQSDSYNCGICLLAYCSAVCNSLNLADSQKEMPAFRVKLYTWLMAFTKEHPTHVPFPLDVEDDRTFAIGVQEAPDQSPSTSTAQEKDGGQRKTRFGEFAQKVAKSLRQTKDVTIGLAISRNDEGKMGPACSEDGKEHEHSVEVVKTTSDNAEEVPMETADEKRKRLQRERQARSRSKAAKRIAGEFVRGVSRSFRLAKDKANKFIKQIVKDEAEKDLLDAKSDHAYQQAVYWQTNQKVVDGSTGKTRQEIHNDQKAESLLRQKSKVNPLTGNLYGEELAARKADYYASRKNEIDPQTGETFLEGYRQHQTEYWSEAKNDVVDESGTTRHQQYLHYMKDYMKIWRETPRYSGGLLQTICSWF